MKAIPDLGLEKRTVYQTRKEKYESNNMTTTSDTFTEPNIKVEVRPIYTKKKNSSILEYVELKKTKYFNLTYFTIGKCTFLYVFCPVNPMEAGNKFLIKNLPTPLICLGPDCKNFLAFFISILLYFAIINVSSIIFCPFKLISTVLMTLSFSIILTSLVVYLINPGIKFKVKEETVFCELCKIYYPWNSELYHCMTCKCCVMYRDHHCGVFGKCIAGWNLFFFYYAMAGHFIYCVFSVASLFCSLASLDK